MTCQPADDVVALLDRLHFAGNNGWFDGPGKRDAEWLLRELRAAAPDVDAHHDGLTVSIHGDLKRMTNRTELSNPRGFRAWREPD